MLRNLLKLILVGAMLVVVPSGFGTDVAKAKFLSTDIPVEPKCQKNCSLRDMFRFVKSGNRRSLQSASVALLHDSPRNLGRDDKYAFINQIATMSSRCIETVRHELLLMIVHKSLIRKNLNSAISLANTWDIVWSAIDGTQAGRRYMSDLSSRGFKTASKNLSKDYAAGKLHEIAQLDPKGAVSTGIRNLSKVAAGVADSNISYVTLVNVESDGCFTRVGG
jgi:hypothetical protein